jgi:hypothetical protein
MNRGNGRGTVIESAERIIRIGFKRDPRKIFDEIEGVSSEMLRYGWYLKDTCFEDGMAYVHLFFERDAEKSPAITSWNTTTGNH